mgnify:CR=1 FL=1
MHRSFVQQYQLADLFDRTVAMVRRTWKTSLILGGSLLILPSVLFGFALPASMERVADAAMAAGPQAGPGAAWQILGGMGWVWVSSLLIALVYLLAFLSVTHAARAAAFGGEETPTESLARAFGNSFLPVIAQSLLKGLILTVISAVPTVFVVLSLSLDAATLVFSVLAGITYVAGLLAGIWVWVSLLFSPQAVVFDKAGVLGGLRDSLRLVRGSWWRVFGIVLLVQIILSFAVGIISTPLVGATVIPAATEMIRSSAEGTISDAEIIETLTAFRSLGVATAVGVFVQQLLTVIIIPVFYSLFYIDLKVRSGSLESEGE